MAILLFGISNIGKSVTGKLLSKRLNNTFYNFDEEVKKHLKIAMEEFVSTGTLYERDQIRRDLINSLIAKKGTKL